MYRFNESIFQWTLISPEEKQILAGLSPGLTIPLVELNQAMDAMLRKDSTGDYLTYTPQSDIVHTKLQ